MRINFKHISISNFRSIEHIDLILESRGTVVVKGINDYEQVASSNGSGKSSMFEAIIFALFDETSSGDKQVANRITNNGYKIELEYDVDENKYKIIRECTNNKTTVVFYKNNEDVSARNKTDTNKFILDTLGISKDIFLDSIILSQNVNTNLTSLSPTARKERLEILTSTNTVIENFKEYLKTKQLYYEAQRVQSINTTNTLLGNKQALQNQIENLQSKIQQIKQEQQKKLQLGTIQDIESEIEQKQIDIKSLDEEALTCINEMDGLQKDQENLNKQQEEIQIELDKFNEVEKQLLAENNSIESKRTNNYTQINNIDKNVTQITSQIEEIKNSDTCPTCGRKYENFDDTHIKQTIEKYNNNIEQNNFEKQELLKENKELDKQLAEIIVKIELNKTDVTNVKTKLMESKTKFTELLDTINNLNVLKDTSYQKIQTLQKQITQLTTKKQELETELNTDKINEYETIIKDLTKQITAIDVQIEDEQKITQQHSDYVDVCKNSIQLVTKDFRTYLLLNSIEYLNNLLTGFSKSLFSNNKDVIKIIGNDSKLSIYLGDATFESLSGGEKTRVNIALLLAQKSLANYIGNISSNIIILDEVLGSCDNQAEESVINLLSEELDSLDSIFMISHKELPIAYDSQITIIKNEAGLSNILFTN